MSIERGNLVLILVIVPCRACICDIIISSSVVSGIMGAAFSTIVTYCRLVLKGKVILVIVEANFKEFGEESRAS